MLLTKSISSLNPACRVLIRTTLLSVILRIYTVLVCSPFAEFFDYWNKTCESLPKTIYTEFSFHHETLLFFNKDEFCKARTISPILWALSVPFISFDGERFLKIANDDLTYNFEHNGPFFPGLPSIIYLSSNIFQFFYRKFVGPELPPRIIFMAIGGLIINNIAFILASLTLYYVVLNFDCGKYKDVAEDAAFWFSLNPSSIHSNSLYTEPLFSLSVHLSTLLLIKSESSQNILKYLFEFIAICLLTFSGGLRSNGIFYLAPLFFYKLRTWKYLENFYKISFDFKILIKSILYWGIALVEAIVVVFPFILFETKLYFLFCVPKNDIVYGYDVIRPWCKLFPPFSYSFIQKEYWDVSFLWVLKEPNRISRLGYALPVFIPAIELIISKIISIEIGFDSLKSHEIGYFISFFVTFLTFLIYAHCEVFMRQTLSHHIFFIHISMLIKENNKYSIFIRGFFILYFFIGATLFGMRIGWT